MMKPIPALNSELQSLADIHDAVARAQAVLKGDFRKEIDAMKEIRRELAERQGTIDTVEKANAAKAEADAYAARIRQDADSVMSGATDAANRAASQLATAHAREEAVAVREANVQARAEDLDAKAAQAKSAADQRSAALAKREADLAAKEADLAKRLSMLSAKEKQARELIASMAA